MDGGFLKRITQCGVAVVALLFVMAPLTSAIEFSPVMLTHSPSSGYISEIYVPRTQFYLFFVSEPVRFDLILFNQGGDAIELRTSASNTQDAFEFADSVGGATAFTGHVTVGAVIYEGLGPRRSIPFANRIRVEPGQQIVFQCEIAPGDLAPGNYRVEVHPQIEDERGRQLAPVGSILNFEVRDLSTPQARADASLRRGYQAYFADRYDETAQIADELLRLNPNSFAALILKAKSLARSNREEAGRLYRAALSAVENNEDPWCSRCDYPLSRSNLESGLRGLLNCFVKSGFPC